MLLLSSQIGDGEKLLRQVRGGELPRVHRLPHSGLSKAIKDEDDHCAHVTEGMDAGSWKTTLILKEDMLRERGRVISLTGHKRRAKGTVITEEAGGYYRLTITRVQFESPKKNGRNAR